MSRGLVRAGQVALTLQLLGFLLLVDGCHMAREADLVARMEANGASPEAIAASHARARAERWLHVMFGLTVVVAALWITEGARKLKEGQG